MLLGGNALAQTEIYWNGAADNGVWSDDNNWSGGIAPANGDIPMFYNYHGSTTRNITVDGDDKILTTLRLDSDAANDFTFTGSAFEFAPYNPIGTYYGIHVRSTSAVATFNNDIRFKGGNHIIAGGGSLTFNGNIDITSVGSGSEYLINYNYAAAGASFTQGASSILSGTNLNTQAIVGGDISHTFNFNGANTFTLQATSLFHFYGSGTLNLGHSQALGAAGNGFVVGLGSYSTAEQRSVLITGNHTIANTVYLRNANGSSTIGGTNTSGTARWSGDIYTYYNNEGPDTTNPLKFTSAAGGTVEFSGKLTSFPEGGTGVAGVFEVVGAGTVAFTRAAGNTYTGGTRVSSGTLLIKNTSGSATGSGFVDVETGATLAGSGFIVPDADELVTIDGILRPGSDAGNILTFGLTGESKLSFGSGSALELHLGDSSTRIAFANVGDWLVGTENATLSLMLGDGFDYGISYLIFSNVTTAGIGFLDVIGYDSANYSSLFTQVGNDYYLQFEAIPEPSTVALLLVPALGLGVCRLRRTRRA